MPPKADDIFWQDAIVCLHEFGLCTAVYCSKYPVVHFAQRAKFVQIVLINSPAIIGLKVYPMLENLALSSHIEFEQNCPENVPFIQTFETFVCPIFVQIVNRNIIGDMDIFMFK